MNDEPRENHVEPSRVREQPNPAVLALVTAQALALQGNFLEGIEVLRKANRIHRNGRLDRELLKYRRQAFEKIPHPNPIETPKPSEDLFPGVEGLPEIDAKELTVERLRSAILFHGALIVRNLIASPHVETLKQSIGRALQGFDLGAAGVPPEKTSPWFVPYVKTWKSEERYWIRNSGGILAVDSPEGLYNAVEAFEDAGIRSLAESYFGERPAILGSKWTLRKISHDIGECDWHQDGAFLGESVRTLNVWVSLSDCGEDAPGLQIVGRRLNQIVETGTEGAQFDWTVGNGVVERVSDGRTFQPICRPGDAILFDQMNLHRTASSKRFIHDRYAIEAWLIAPSTFASLGNVEARKDSERWSDHSVLMF